MKKSRKEEVIEIDKFYGKYTEYFSKLAKLPNGKKILNRDIESIREAAEKRRAYCLIIDRSEFKNSSIESIMKQMNEKFFAMVYLAERMGYKVINKRQGVQYTGDTILFVLDIKKGKKNFRKPPEDTDRSSKVIQFNELVKRIMCRHEKNKDLLY